MTIKAASSNDTEMGTSSLWVKAEPGQEMNDVLSSRELYWCKIRDCYSSAITVN